MTRERELDLERASERERAFEQKGRGERKSGGKTRNAQGIVVICPEPEVDAVRCVPELQSTVNSRACTASLAYL